MVPTPVRIKFEDIPYIWKDLIYNIFGGYLMHEGFDLQYVHPTVEFCYLNLGFSDSTVTSPKPAVRGPTM